MKKKPIIISIAAVCCICVLTLAYTLNAGGETQPSPEPLPIEDSAGDIESKNIEVQASDWSIATPAPAGSELSQLGIETEDYPKVVEKDPDTVVIDFTDPDKGKTTPPPTPDSNVPAQTQPTVEPSPAIETPTPAPATPTPKPKATATPKPDTSGTRSDGAVYDPVFGWVVPGKAVGIPAHSDGDINKQVGSMGGD